LQVEALEARRVLAAYINEVHFSPLFGDATQDQYVEIRGEPNAVLPEGTYFLGIESADGVGELGDIHTIIDLSDEQFGSNGILVMLQSGSRYAVDPASRVLRGTDGFNGMPRNNFRADNNAKSIHAGSTTYLLIQSSSVPQLNMDIDANDNGVPDGEYFNWQILDGFSALVWVEQPFHQRAFAPIVFSEDGVGEGLPNATFVVTEQLAYVGRIHNSVGYQPGDWLTGNTVEIGNTGQFQLQHGVFGTPRPRAFAGRILEHVGAPNWYGDISGAVFQDDDQDGVRQAGEPGIEGVSVGIERPAASLPGYFTETIEPNDFAVDAVVTNASSLVTLVTAGTDDAALSFKITAVQRPFASAGEHVFAHAGVGFFNNSRKLRLDFYRPAHSVSIDVIGDSDLSATYGRLEIFRADGTSLGFVRTQALGRDDVERLTMSSPNDDIAFALAYSDQAYLNSSPFGKLDGLSYEFRDTFSTTTGADGSYLIPNVPRGSYSVVADVPSGYAQTFPAGGQPQAVSMTSSYGTLANVDFGLEGVLAATLADQNISTNEARPAGLIAALPVSLGYATQRLNITITAGDPTGLFRVDSGRFELILNRPELDFETLNSYTLELLLVDRSNPSLSETATINLSINDVNESPVVVPMSVSVAEYAADGSAVATLQGSDEDAGLAGQFVWSLVGGNPGGAFVVDPNTGAVSVQHGGLLDFETTPVWQLTAGHRPRHAESLRRSHPGSSLDGHQ